MTLAEMSFIPDVLLKLEELAETAGWDQLASLYALHAEHLTDDVTAVGVAEFPGFDASMAIAGHSFYALKAVTGALKVAPPGVRPDLSGLFAVVLVDECWMVKADPGKPRPTGSLADHPDRVEQRFVWLVAADGSARVLTRQRGETEPTLADDFGTGRLLDAVTELLAEAVPQ